MVKGIWAWSTDGGNTQNAFLILKENKFCEFQNLQKVIQDEFNGQCSWFIDIETKQLVLVIPEGAYGDFVPVDMLDALMTKYYYSLEEYHEMVEGAWSWSTDGTDDMDAIIFLEPESHCAF